MFIRKKNPEQSIITSLTTDKNGGLLYRISILKHYLKELSAVGYVLDPTDVDCTYESATVPTVEELLYAKKPSSSDRSRSSKAMTTERPMQICQRKSVFSLSVI